MIGIHAPRTACLLFALLPPPPETPPDKPSPYKTVRHEQESEGREGWYLSLAGEVRERFEAFKHAGLEAAGRDGFFLQRYMLAVDLHHGSAFRFFTQTKVGLAHGRDGGPRSTDEDRLDVHEAFVDVGFGTGPRATLRAGRQELAFGSQRLVSVRAGPNVRQSFDGVALILRPGAWRVDVFAAKPARTEPGVFDDGPDHARTFWGVYAVGRPGILTGPSVDLYYLGLDRKLARFDQGTASELRESAGLRLWRTTDSWDYNFEVVYQWGRFGVAPIRAWTVASDTGLSLPHLPWRPRIGLKADVTSGDANPADPVLQSFNPLFPRGGYFGENQLVGPVNHIDLHPGIDLHPTASLTLSPSWLFVWRQNLGDGLYGVPGNLVRSGRDTSSRYVGSQPAVTATVTLGRHVTIGSTFEYFIAGPFLEESGPGHDVSFFSGWLGFVF